MALTKATYSMIQGAVVNVLDFGADPTGVASSSAAIQAAINSITSGVVFIPKGTYLITTAVTTKSGITIKGEGTASQLLVNTDIEVFNSATTTANTAVFEACFSDFYINKTVSTATTKYDIHLQNPSFCNMTRLHIKSGHDDTQYSNTNVGGIWLDRPSGSTAAAFCNRVDDCWIQNNSIYFLNITDSAINGGFVWGHTRQFAICLRANGGSCGAIGIENVVGIICSKYEGGIWLDGPSINQIRIVGNEFDGNPLLDTGYGVLCLQQALTVTITGNTFWGCDYHAIWAKDATNWSITGNNFWKNGARDDILYGYDDIRLEGVNIPVGSVTITGNSHLIDDARTNPGFAVRFVVSTYQPDRCSVVGNTVKGSYQGSGFYIVGNVQFTGNQPLTTNPERLVSGNEIAGNFVSSSIYTAGVRSTANDQVAGNGTLEISLNPDGGADCGFVGHLYVTSTRLASETVSTRTIYTVVGHGTTSTITSIATQNGSGGGSTFTITNPSAGVIRFTDTSGVFVVAGITFVGSRGL